MLFTFETPKPNRILRYGIGIQTNNPDLWWSDRLNKWVDYSETKGFPCGNTAPCRTYKAFKRHLRKHKNELLGYRVTFVNRFIGHNVCAYLEEFA